MNQNKKTLRELGFKTKKEKTRRKSREKSPLQPPTSTTLERLQERF